MEERFVSIPELLLADAEKGKQNGEMITIELIEYPNSFYFA